MTAKELKKLSRLELIEIIAAQKKQELALREQLERSEQQLSDRTIRISKAGSIAEAALDLKGVFASAQAAADAYLQSIVVAHEEIEKRKADTEEECKRTLAEANKKAEAIVREAKERAARMIVEANALAKTDHENDMPTGQ